MKRVAAQLGYGAESVRSWVRQADIDEGHLAGVSTSESERMKALEQEVRELGAGKRDLEEGREFLRGGARPPAQEVAAFIDANRGRCRRGPAFGGRAHLRSSAGGPEQLLRGQEAEAIGTVEA